MWAAWLWVWLEESDLLSKEDGIPKSPIFFPVTVAVHLRAERPGLIGGRERPTEGGPLRGSGLPAPPLGDIRLPQCWC